MLDVEQFQAAQGKLDAFDMLTLFEQRPGKFIQRPGVDAVFMGDDPALQVVNQGQKRNIFVYGEKQLQAFGGFVVGAALISPMISVRDLISRLSGAM